MKAELFSKSYLRKLCKEYKLHSPRQFGQHFLIKEGPINTMLREGNLDKKDTVVEIGPGFGVLTFSLTEEVSKVIAFEIEKKLREYWKREKQENIELIWGDGIEKFKRKNSELPRSYKFISNLPYQITSRVLRTVLSCSNKPDIMVVMVQREVAERICSDDNKSLLTIAIQLYGDAELVDTVSSESFWPPPKVNSAIVNIKNIKSPNINEEKFFKVVKAGFAHKRKQLKNNLSANLNINKPEAAKILDKVCDNEQIRAQKLSVKQWKQLSELITVQ